MGQGKHPSSLQTAAFCIAVCLLLVNQPAYAGYKPAVHLPRAAQQAQGYWKFLEVWTAKSPEAVLPDKSDATVGDGSMSGSYTSAAANGSPAITYSFSCTWFWQTPGGLDKLVPGQQITGSMTVTDTSSGKFGNTDGAIALGQPYLPIGNEGSAEVKLLDVKSGSLRSSTQNGQLVIPQGPGDPAWQGKMALKALCSNKEAGYFERIYEWIPAGAALAITTVEATPKTVQTPGGVGLPQWVVSLLMAAVGLVGFLVLAGIAVIVLILVRSKRGQPILKTAQPLSPYLIKLSTDALDVRIGDSAPLEAQVYQVTPEGENLPCPDAPIRVIFPPSAAGLLVAPTNGQGSLQCVFSAPQATASAQVMVTITTSAGGIKTSAHVAVHIVPSFTLQMTSREPQNSIQPGGDGLWIWAKINSNPADSLAPVDSLTQQINFHVIGANQEWIVLNPPIFKDGMQGVQVSAVLPDAQAVLQDGNPYLVAECLAGPQKLSARMELGLNTGLILDAWVNGQKQAGVFYDRTLSTPGWVFSDINVYFHSANEKDRPVIPNFKYSFPTPPVQIDPPVLNIFDFYERQPAQFTIKVSVKSLEELERYFGKDLADRKGLINIIITAKDDAGQVYQTTVAYQLQPQIEFFTQIRGESQHRFYRNLNLGGQEILADGENQLEILLACCRTDKPGVREIGQVDLVDPAWINLNNQVQGEAAPGFDLVSTNEKAESGIMVAVVSSKPVIYTQERALQKLMLHLEVSLSGRAPVNYYHATLIKDMELKPRYPDLRLWVVPGKKRGTSEAWMYLFLDHSPQQPLVDCTLKVETVSPGSSQLKLANGSAADVVQTGKDGMAQIELVYEKLNWANLQEAKYSVAGMLQASNGTVSDKQLREIDVAKNVQRMLADLSQNSESLKLNNPYFQQESLLKVVRLTTYRPALRGPIWNMAGVLTGEDKESKEDKFFRDYISSSYRNRIARWLCKRRNYQPGMPDKVEMIFDMNGIEFENFYLGGLHVWEAVFLAGMDPLDDPRGLDPWWKQHWLSGDYLEPEGLLSKSWERYHFLEMNNWITAIGNGSLMVLLTSFFAALSLALYLTIDSVTSVYKTYSAVFDLQCGPDYRYDPAGGYGYYDPTEGIPESKKQHTYVSRERFIADWVEVHPQG